MNCKGWCMCSRKRRRNLTDKRAHKLQDLHQRNHMCKCPEWVWVLGAELELVEELAVVGLALERGVWEPGCTLMVLSPAQPYLAQQCSIYGTRMHPDHQDWGHHIAHQEPIRSIQSHTESHLCFAFRSLSFPMCCRPGLGCSRPMLAHL